MILLSFCVASCNKNDEAATPLTPSNAGFTHAFVLNEGLFNLNNSTLTRYDSSGTVTQDYFAVKNGRGLGDTGNDIAVYGGKIYVVVNVSSQIEVLDKEGNSIRQIPLFDANDVPRQPRYIAFHQNKAYVCSFDGTVARIDTGTLNIEAVITVGKNPDGICVANNKLYVSNSGGLDFPNYDSTVSVVDIPTFSETKKITVRINPYKIAADAHGDVYVISRGNYADIKYCLQRINTTSDQLVQTFEDLEVLNFAVLQDSAYLYKFDFFSASTSFIKMDLRTEQILDDNFINDGSIVQTPYGISIDEGTGDIYIADAFDFTVTGTVHCFSREGRRKFSFEAGLNPQKMVFVR